MSKLSKEHQAVVESILSGEPVNVDKMKLSPSQQRFIDYLLSGKLVEVSGSVFTTITCIFVDDKRQHATSIKSLNILLSRQLIKLGSKGIKLRRTVYLTELAKSIFQLGEDP